MTGLLRLLREHEEAVEADLARYYNGLDYRDRWRRDEHGRRKLTLRMIRVRIRHLPPASATGTALGLDTGWTVGDYLLADLYTALSGKKHPARPKPKKKQQRTTTSARRAGQRAAALRRKREREAQIAAGTLT